MADYVDPYCPFCRTEGRVDVYAARTSAYDTLYRCGLCYKVFDQKDRDIQETKNRQKKKPKEEVIVPIVQRKTKKNWLTPTLFIVAFGFACYHFFSNR